MEVLFPKSSPANIDALVGRITRSRTKQLHPFSDVLLEFFGELSQAIFTANREHQYAELQALAFWMRPAALKKLRDIFASELPKNVIAMPRGISFHVTPSNVDTMPIYSLLLSLICGNSNVVRVSSRSGPQFSMVVDCIEQVLAQSDLASTVSDLITLVRYDRAEFEPTLQLSRCCDTRVLWGGDTAITEIRQSPLSIGATEVVFPDRTSWAVLRASQWNTLSPPERTQVLTNLFNDTLALDQLACSSPHTILFVGPEHECEVASESFWPAMDAYVQSRGYELGGASTVTKFVTAWGVAMDAGSPTHVWRGKKLTVVKGCIDAQPVCGLGYFYERNCRELIGITPWIGARDQTLTYQGFERDEILSLAQMLNGHAFTRYVPWGAALQFSHLWEGFDLLRTFTKLVHVR